MTKYDDMKKKNITAERLAYSTIDDPDMQTLIFQLLQCTYRPQKIRAWLNENDLQNWTLTQEFLFLPKIDVELSGIHFRYCSSYIQSLVAAAAGIKEFSGSAYLVKKRGTHICHGEPVGLYPTGEGMGHYKSLTTNKPSSVDLDWIRTHDRCYRRSRSTMVYRLFPGQSKSAKLCRTKKTVRRKETAERKIRRGWYTARCQRIGESAVRRCGNINYNPLLERQQQLQYKHSLVKIYISLEVIKPTERKGPQTPVVHEKVCLHGKCILVRLLIADGIRELAPAKRLSGQPDMAMYFNVSERGKAI
ncbi:hypothetical protein C8J56DRAFT_886834 [Mycena floridula]|nr:hypothetical protein C8J56DRAFT_886834 [Mycena floridula]